MGSDFFRGRDVIMDWRFSYLESKFADGSFYHKNLVAHFGCVNAVEFSTKDEAWLVSGGDDKRVLLWSMGQSSWRPTQPTPIVMDAEHMSNIFCLAFDNSNAVILSSGNDHQVIVHDVQTRRPKNIYLLDDACYSLSMHPECDALFAAATQDGIVQVFDMRSKPTEANAKEGAQVWDIRKPESPLLRYGQENLSYAMSAMSVRWNSTGRHLLVIRRKMEPSLYDTLSSKALATFDHDGYYNSCTMKSCSFAGPNDEYVMSGSDDFRVFLWKIPAGLNAQKSTKRVKSASIVLAGHVSIVNQVRYNKTYHVIASSGVEKVVKLWSPFPLTQSKTWRRRPLYTQEECASLVLQSGRFMMNQDVSGQTTSEDPRMLAFFDSLVQQEMGTDSDSSSSSTGDYDEEAYEAAMYAAHQYDLHIGSNRPGTSYSHVVVDSDSDDSSSSGLVDRHHESGGEYIESEDPSIGLRWQPRMRNPDGSLFEDDQISYTAMGVPVVRLPVDLGYLPNQPERVTDVTALAIRKRKRQQKHATLLKAKRCRIMAEHSQRQASRRGVNRSRRGETRSAARTTSLSADEARQRVDLAQRHLTARQQTLQRIRRRAMLESSSSDDESSSAMSAAAASAAEESRNDGVHFEALEPPVTLEECLMDSESDQISTEERRSSAGDDERTQDQPAGSARFRRGQGQKSRNYRSRH